MMTRQIVLFLTRADGSPYLRRVDVPVTAEGELVMELNAGDTIEQMVDALCVDG